MPALYRMSRRLAVAPPHYPTNLFFSQFLPFLLNFLFANIQGYVNFLFIFWYLCRRSTRCWLCTWTFKGQWLSPFLILRVCFRNAFNLQSSILDIPIYIILLCDRCHYINTNNIVYSKFTFGIISQVEVFNIIV